MDYDGDGKTDICHINDAGIHIYSFSRIQQAQNGRMIYNRLPPAPHQKICFNGVGIDVDRDNRLIFRRTLLVGDINGDGKTDI